MSRPRRHRRNAAALVSAVVVLVVVAAFAAVFLSVHSAQVSTEQAGIHRLRAEAAALSATYLTLWDLSNDSTLKAALSRVVYEGDTSYEADPLITVNGDLSGATFSVDVWPGPDAVRLKATGVSGGCYYDRWAQMSMSLGTRFGDENIESSNLNNVADEQIAMQATLLEDGTLMSISAYVKGTSTKDLRCALYSDAGGEPGSLIVETAAEATGSNLYHWHTIDVTPTSLTAGTYWLAIAFGNASQSVTQTDPGAGQLRRKDNDAVGGGFLSSWGTSDVSDTTQVSIYGTYEPD
jgi:hypothetical protein